MQYYCGYLIDVKTDMFTELHILFNMDGHSILLHNVFSTYSSI